MKLGEEGRAQQLAGSIVMALAEIAREIKSRLGVTRPGGAGHRQELVSNLGHGTDYNHRLLAKPFFDNAGNPLDRSSVPYRGAAEFHDDHGCGFLSNRLCKHDVAWTSRSIPAL